MKVHHVNILIVTALMVICGTNSDEISACDGKSNLCLDCKTLAKCEEDASNVNKTFKWVTEKTCGRGFVCDQLDLDCVREGPGKGTCRNQPFKCPQTDCESEAIFPDPYSCLVYHGCEKLDQYDYKCLNGMAFNPVNMTCTLDIHDISCADYPILCESNDQTGNLGSYSYTCAQSEDGKALYPVFTPICPNPDPDH